MPLSKRLNEYKYVKQYEGEPRRRWFCDNNFDLIVFYSSSDAMIGFHLCYSEADNKKILMCDSRFGFSHGGIDDGEQRCGKLKSTPIVVSDGIFQKSDVKQRFQEASKEMEFHVVDFVLDRIDEYKDS